jgi:phosphohistidine swiveling domain-containing protein
MSGPSRMLIPLARASDARTCGAKAANLARLLRAGVQTAPGVVVPVAALLDHLQRAGHARAIDIELPHLTDCQLGARAAALRAAVLDTPLAPSLTQALVGYFAQLPAGTRLAVRSSGVAEDGERASFAGQFDTRLGVDSSEPLEQAVREVWASLFSERAVRYAQRIDARPAGLAVILQCQVEASVSGVLFSRDPVTGGDAMLLEYCAGLGERLVGGQITPARLRIDRRTLIGVQEQPRGEPLTHDPARAPMVAQLARVGLKLESVFGIAQDIEWSIDAAGRLIVLQSRAITGTVKTVWSNANIAENFPEPITPFLYSFVARGYAAYFRNLGRAFGISRRRMRALDEALEQIVGTHGGRLYYNLSNIHSVLHLAPGGAWLARFFNQFTGADRFPPPRRVEVPLHVRVAEALRIAVRVPWHYLTVQRRVARFEAVADEFARSTQPHTLCALSERALAEQIRVFLDIRLRRWTDAALADTAAMVCYGGLKALLARWLSHCDQTALQNDLLKGLPGLASAAPVERLWALSRMACDEARLQRLLRDAPAESVIERLQSEEFCQFREALGQYFTQWGFRYSGELMLTQPTPQEQPLPVIRLLQMYVRLQQLGPAEISAAQARAREAETERVATALTAQAWRRALPLMSRAGWFRLVLRATQGAIRLRERARMKQALLYTRLRHVALALGDRLAARGIIERREDVFFLTTDEAIALATGGTPLPGATAAIVAARKRDHAACAGLLPPDEFTLDHGMQWTPATIVPPAALVKAADRMQGSGACGGSALGRATVALDVQDAHRIAAGGILVTRQTDPGWAAVFFLIKGLVVERGGMLSHGAIIAREYGIPAVVGVTDATRIIRDGDVVRVDGDLGVVERCDG